MGRTFASVEPAQAEFLARQPVFFIATAPSGDGGHVNLSPKGYDTLRVLDPNTVAYLDLTGSGVETIAHARQNGRITIMACAFDTPPMIVRVYGRGEVVTPAEDRFGDLVARFPVLPGTRAVVLVHVERVSTSCGYGVPVMALQGERPMLTEWAERRGAEGVAEYRAERNATSIDGLPGLA